MADETFRPTKIEKDTSKNQDTLDQIAEVRNQASNQATPDGGVQVTGNVPQEFLNTLQQQRNQKNFNEGPKKFGRSRDEVQNPREMMPGPQRGGEELKKLLQQLQLKQQVYETIQLPSLGKFYDGSDGPRDGILNVRPMTGEEEQILATPRFVRKGQAINMIFSRCIQDKEYKPDLLLTTDRTYLLIFLRGISYSPEYDVEIKCAECDKKFSTVIDLNSLFVEQCPSDFGPTLEDVLPNSGFRFSYRLSRGKDENEIQDYRDRRIKMFGDAAADDTLTYRTAQLVTEMEEVTDKREIQTLIQSLPISDVSYIRNLVNEPPFGVETGVEIVCPSCLHEFEIELPLEANFFFPRRKRKDKTRA